ncbi:MAG TPA: hypothetical protein VK943_20715 [Arenibaculum sp.]|nr:hypothetical protein [Arenibaculum sp.]
MSTIRLLLILIAFTTTACATPPQAAGPSAQAVSVLESRGAHTCTPAIASALADEGIDPSSVTNVSISDERREPGTTDDVLAYIAWMRLEGQPGHLVASLDGFCRVRDVYTRGGAQVAGVSSY